jgi:hypothetical protein
MKHFVIGVLLIQFMRRCGSQAIQMAHAYVRDTAAKIYAPAK